MGLAALVYFLYNAKLLQKFEMVRNGWLGSLCAAGQFRNIVTGMLKFFDELNARGFRKSIKTIGT